MKKFITPYFALLLILSLTHQLNAQNVGVNTLLPEAELDIRPTNPSGEGELNVGSFDNSFFLRLYSNQKTDLNPGFWWKPGQSLKFNIGDPGALNNTEFVRFDGKTIGIYNTGQSIFIGVGAGENDDLSNNSNLAIGRLALQANVDGVSNVAIGNNVLLSNMGGVDNTGVGLNALLRNETGNFNVALGHSALLDNVSGSRNTIIGVHAGQGTAGQSYSGNVFIGYDAGKNESESDRLYIDNSSTTSPLIWGDFATNVLRTNGKQEVTSDFEVLGNAFFVDQSSAYVGVGTTTPIAELHVKDGIFNATAYALIEAGPGFDPVVALKNTSTGTGSSQWTMRMDASEGERFQLRYNNASKMVVTTEGLFGLGTASQPLTDWHLKGTGFVGTLIQAAPGNDAFIGLKNSTVGSAVDQWTLRIDGSASNRFQWRYDNSSKMVLTTDGDLALGTSVPATGYRLSVNGKIIAEEMRIQLDGNWPDYVFNDEYNLMSLEDLDMSIKENGHLPGIPKAEQVEAEGFDSGEMHRKMMEKIEELTLHVIQLNKKILALESER